MLNLHASPNNPLYYSFKLTLLTAPFLFVLYYIVIFILLWFIYCVRLSYNIALLVLMPHYHIKSTNNYIEIMLTIMSQWQYCEKY